MADTKTTALRSAYTSYYHQKLMQDDEAIAIERSTEQPARRAQGGYRAVMDHHRCTEKHAVYGRCIFNTGHDGEHQGQTHNRLTAWTTEPPPPCADCGTNGPHYCPADIATD